MKGKLLVLLLSLSFLLVLPGLVLAQYGTISGLVTDAQTGLPITGAHVLAMGIDCHASGWSDSNGFYTIPHLQPGAYVVRASAFGYQEQIYPDSIIVMAGQNTPDIDFALTPGSSGGTGSISGRVTDEVTNNPIIMAEIRLSGMCQSVWYTDTAGYYTCTNVEVGFYQVMAYAAGYDPETYPIPVEVVDGQNTPNIDFALAPEGSGGGTGSISGTVTDAETGLPIAMAHVWAHGDSGHHHCEGGEAWTDSIGYYIIQNLEVGQYSVGACKSGYQNELYPELVSVNEGQTTPNIDFALSPLGEPGSISGTIIDVVTGLPIRCAHVWAYGEFGHSQVGTDSLGNYTLYNLYPGSYFLTAWAFGYYPQEYPDTITVLEGQNIPGIDFALTPYDNPANGVIAGQVLDDSTLTPIPDAAVFAVSVNGGWGCDLTDSTGVYLISGLAAGEYYLHACAQGYKGEFYDGVHSWYDATLVTPDAYNINFYLGTCGHEGGSISGTINSNGTPLEGAFVYALVSGEAKGFARSSTEGGYVISGLLPGTYTVTASMVMYHDGIYPNPVEVVIGKAGGVDIDLSAVQVGDATGDGSIDIADVIYLINYLYVHGPSPDPLLTGDLNCDGTSDIGDVIYLINYLFKQGSSPCNL